MSVTPHYEKQIVHTIYHQVLHLHWKWISEESNFYKKFCLPVNYFFVKKITYSFIGLWIGSVQPKSSSWVHIYKFCIPSPLNANYLNWIWPLCQTSKSKKCLLLISANCVQLGVLVPLCKALQLLFTFYKISNPTNLTLLRQPEMMSSYLVFSYGLQPQIPPSLHRNKMHAKHVHMHYACMKTSSGAPASHMVLHCSCYVQNKASKARYLFGRADGVKHD